MPRDYARRAQPSNKTSGKVSKVGRAGKKAAVVQRRTIEPQARMKRPKRSARRTSEKGLPWSKWLRWLIGLMILLAIILMLRMGAQVLKAKLHHAHATASPVLDVSESAPVEQVASAPAVVAIPKPNFVFSPAPLAKEKEHFWLQVGTDVDGDDLTVLKNTLTRLGVKYRDTQLLRNDTVYFRVSVGPYHNESEALQAQLLLRHHRVFSVLRRMNNND